MNFINGILGFGAFAFTVPLIIHLLFRSRFKTVQWGAMHLLDNVLRVNRRRMQLTQLLLLLLRCAIPMLLAFCLTRPVLTGSRAGSGEIPKTLIIALDDSLSLAAAPEGEQPRIEYAKAELTKVLNELTRRDEVILVRSSRLGAVPGKMGASEAANVLRRVSAQGDAVPLGRLIESAVSATQQASNDRRQILLVSDFQTAALDSASLEISRQVASELEADVAAELNAPVIDIMNVAAPWNQLNNVAIQSVELTSPVVVRSRPAVFEATLHNASDTPASGLRLVWSIDGQPLEPRSINIDARSTLTNRLTHVIDQAGEHVVSISVDAADSLLDDNQRSTVVSVADQIDVVLVDGTPSNQALGGQADFLAIALSPFAFGGDERPDPVSATVTSAYRLIKQLDEDPPHVIILAGVNRPPKELMPKLTSFVRQGGSLIVLDGPQVTAEAVNKSWQAGEDQIALPALLGEMTGEINRQPDEESSRYQVDTPSSQYRPWSILSQDQENPFGSIDLFAYRKLTLPETSTITDDLDQPAQQATDDKAAQSDANRQTSASQVLLRTMQGDPLVITQAVGQGTVVQFAFACHDEWSNLPLRPVFLPMIQQMVLDLGGHRGQHLLSPGQPIVIKKSQWLQADNDPDDSAQNAKQSSREDRQSVYWLQTPDERVQLQPVGDDETIQWTATYQPGLYRFEKLTAERQSLQPTAGADQSKSPDKAADQVDSTPAESTLRLAVIDANESMLKGATDAQMDEFAKTLKAEVFTQATSLVDADRTRSFGREIWFWIWVAVVVFLVAELWLQQHLVRRNRNQSASSLPGSAHARTSSTVGGKA